jgi:hypothetical protein
MASSEPKFVIMARADVEKMPLKYAVAYHRANVERLEAISAAGQSRAEVVHEARALAKLLAAQTATPELEVLHARAVAIVVRLGEEVGEEDNFIARYLRTAPAEELKVSDELAELDRKHGNKPTPAA